MQVRPDAFDTRRTAEDWLAGVRTDIARGDWRAPVAVTPGASTLGDYAHRWLDGRLDLAPCTPGC